MLKKKEWLKRYKKLVSASGILDAYTIQETMKDVGDYWKEELSPGEAAEEVIEMARDVKYIYGMN